MRDQYSHLTDQVVVPAVKLRPAGAAVHPIPARPNGYITRESVRSYGHLTCEGSVDSVSCLTAVGLDRHFRHRHHPTTESFLFGPAGLEPIAAEMLCAIEGCTVPTLLSGQLTRSFCSGSPNCPAALKKRSQEAVRDVSGIELDPEVPWDSCPGAGATINSVWWVIRSYPAKESPRSPRTSRSQRS